MHLKKIQRKECAKLSKKRRMVELQEQLDQMALVVIQKLAVAKPAEAPQRCFVANQERPDLIQLPAYADINN
jgi:hypothetical protein